MQIEKYSMGIGDRFGRQGSAQLKAFMQARTDGIEIVPVWNKSHREHTIVHTEPDAVRKEADAAVAAMDWKHSYYVDADHIGLKTVDSFIESSDFFTLDVADFIGKNGDETDIRRFVDKYEKYAGNLNIPGLDDGISVTCEDIKRIANKYLPAVHEAARIYARIAKVKGSDNFITEVSMDETDEPQTPMDMFFILAAMADAGIPAQTVAPKFSGRFNKGIDYVGDVDAFAKEFEADVAVVCHCRKEFGLPANMKLSVHSGSDKFSIYGVIGEIIRRYDAGLHLKTAGTTWLEELIGLAEAGGVGLAVAKDIYAGAHSRFQELCDPYATVIDINEAELPTPSEVFGWDANKFVAALRHDQLCRDYNRNFRQLLHVAYKVAAEMGARYFEALDLCEDAVARNVAENIYTRHLCRVFS
ncbi:MAG: hypothetical protein JXN60_00115 [Lentisphaerae bacterium]|nr:hypothetical protein [Lentisphaerota bacterium]